MSSLRATLLGSIAVLLWALLALFTTLSGGLPPFQLSAICFGLGAAIGLPGLIRKRTSLGRLPARVWLLGVGGIFGYHFFYFTALANAPAAEASLIAYLWPLFIVLFSAALPGERLRAMHILGALIAFAGAALLIARTGFSIAPEHWRGFGAAALCALIWSGYSVASRAVGTVPSTIIAAYCAISAVLALACHLLWEVTVWPKTMQAWLALLALGLGPVGLAFYVWDIGVKRGNIQLLGVLAYGAPMLSTVVLVLAGLAPATPALLGAAALIACGALVAARG
ncbi:MAG: DMT family transporter [Paracoccaceae bacterium]